MSDNTIGAGDLVIVKHRCCERVVQGSPLFVVGGFWTAPTQGLEVGCLYCGAKMPAEVQAWDGIPANGRPAYPLSWLRKVPPLRDSEAADELVSAPALPPETLTA